MKILLLIPARMGSTRFPGKPLAPIHGVPMIGHVLAGVQGSSLVTDIAVATCDEEIAKYVESLGAQYVMTSDQHERASDRCAEAVIQMESQNKEKYDIVVMVQGDEPMVTSEMVDQALEPMLRDSSILVTNLLGQISKDEEFFSPNTIKVVCDNFGDALYFSRQAIPTYSPQRIVPRTKQVCVIPFRRDFLMQYAAMAPTPLEIAESIDMLRVLEHGYKVRMVPTDFISIAVDTPADLERLEKTFKGHSSRNPVK